MLPESNDEKAPVVLPHVVAEALVQRMSESEVLDKARAVGLTGQIAEVALKLCGCGKSAAGVAAGAK